jgi:hypothetical protein
MSEQRDLYPTADQTFYGRHVWPLGLDCDQGVMAEGHGLRALAALNAHQRDIDGSMWRWSASSLTKLDIAEVWVTFRETCGCTPEQHAEHIDELTCECESPGLPPCEPEQFAWTYTRVEPGTSGALPVTEVLW